MAENRNRRPSGRKPAGSRSRPGSDPRRRPRRRRKPSLWQVLADRITRYRAERSEFRPDSQESPFLKSLHFTHQQRIRLLRWVLLSLVCILCLVVQDCVMSQVSIFRTTTDLCVGAMLIIAVIEGSEVGSVFILIASCIYYFSGSAPGPYSVGMLSLLGMLASLFRQQFWHRSSGSILFCSGLAVMLYEIGLYIVGMSMGLTRWYRFPRFFLTGALTVAVMIPLYRLINRIGLIGGNTCKE